jgi:hypothetical protein
MITIDDIMSMDTKNVKSLPWNKLDKSLKLTKINDYIDEFGKLHHLDESTLSDLRQLLKEKLNKKLLHKSKDVIYDIKSDTIKSIPSLVLHNNKYIIKSIDHVSPLHSLTPKNKTVKKPQ